MSDDEIRAKDCTLFASRSNYHRTMAHATTTGGDLSSAVRCMRNAYAMQIGGGAGGVMLRTVVHHLLPWSMPNNNKKRTTTALPRQAAFLHLHATARQLGGGVRRKPPNLMMMMN